MSKIKQLISAWLLKNNNDHEKLSLLTDVAVNDIKEGYDNDYWQIDIYVKICSFFNITNSITKWTNLQ